MLLEPLPSLNKVFAMMIQQERDIGIHAQPTGESQGHAFLAKSGFGSQGLAPRPPTFKKQGKRPVCSYCGFVGHTVEVFYKKNGYPPGYQHRPRAAPRANAVSASPMDAAIPEPSDPTSSTVQVSQADWTSFQQQYQRMAAAFQPSQSSGADHHTAAAVRSQRLEVPEQNPSTILRSPAAVYQAATVSNGDTIKHGNSAAAYVFDPTGASSTGVSQFEDDWYS